MLRRLWRHLHATSCTSTSSGSGHVHENNRGPGLVSASNTVTNEETTATVASASPTASSHSGRTASRPSRKRDKEKTTTRTSSDKAKAAVTQDKAVASSAATGATQQAASSDVSVSTSTTTNTTAAATVVKHSTASPVAEKKIAASDIVTAPPQAKSDAAAPEVHSPAPVTSYENDEDDDGVIGFLDNVIAGNTDQLRKEFAEQKLLSMAQSLPSATKAVPVGPATPTPSSAENAKASESANTSNKVTVQAADSAPATTISKGDEAAPANTTVTRTTTKGSTKPSTTTARAITSTNKQATAHNAPHSGYVSSAARSLQEYELVAYLGSGTFAEVTLARHRRTQELFAIKKTSKQRVREEGCVQRTFTERQLLTSMRHPFLVRLFQAFQSPTHLYYVLEFAQGGDLYYFNESRPWVREAKRSLYKLNYPYYVSSALPTTIVSNSSRRTHSFGSGALSNNHTNKDTQSAAEDNVTASTEAWGWRLSAAQLAHNRSFGACSMLTEDDIEMANVNRSFATRDEASAGGTVRHQRQSAGTHRSGRAGNDRRMSRRRQRMANVVTDTTKAEAEGTTMADASPASANTKDEVTPTKLDTTKSGTCGDKDSSPVLCETSGVGASPLRRHTTETGVASFTQTAAATTNNNTTAPHTPPPQCHADSTHATASGEMKTPQTVSIAGLLMQQSSASSDKAHTITNNNTPASQLRPSASTSVGATSQTPTPRKAMRNDNDNSEDGGDTKEPSRTPITSLTATPRKTKAGDTEHAEATPSGSRPRRVDVLGARFVERHLEDCTVPLPRPYAEDGTRLPIRIIAFFAIEIALVLQYMHGEGFIYRDLKPENILIKRDGHITLTDFGVAKYRKGAAITPVPRTNNASSGSNAATAAASEATTRQPVVEKESGKPTGKAERTTSFTGTTHYMSPEMLQGLPHDFRTDWWSYGCLLFEWTNGHKAFDNPSQFALFKSIVEEDVKIDAETDFRLTGLELHRRTAQLYRRFQQTASMQAVSLAASASRLAASMTADDVRRHDSALLSRRNSGGLDRGRMRSSLTSIDNTTVAPSPAEHTTKAKLDTSALPKEEEEEGNDDHESKKPMTSAAHTEPPSCATTPPNNGSFPAMTLQSFAALSFAGSTATPPPPATLSRSRSGSRRLTLPPQLALERLQRRTLTHTDRDLLLCHATRQLEEAMGLLRELILALLDRRMERRLCGEAVLAHPFFSCPYVVSQLYYSHAFLAEMLARHAGQRGHTTQQLQESNIEGTGVTSPVNHTGVSATDGNEAGSLPPSSDASIITLETFLRDTVYLRRPADWATLFLNLQIRPPYVPRLRAQDDLRYFPSAVTAMGLSVMAEQRKKLKEAHDLQRQQQQEKQQQQQQQQQIAQAREQEKWRHLSFRSNAGGKAWQDIYSFAVPDMAAAVEDEASVDDKVSHHGHRRHRQRRMLQNLSFPDESVLRRMRQAREANEALAAVASSRKKKNTATVCDDDEAMKRGEEEEGRVASMKPPSAANKAEGNNSVKGSETLPTNSSSAHTRRSHSAEVPSTSQHARTEDTAHEEKEVKGETAAATLLPSSGPHRRNKSVTIVYDERSHGELHSSLASLPDSHRAEDEEEEEDNTTIDNTRTTSILPQPPPRRVQSAGLPETPTLLAQLPSPSESILTPTRTAVMSRVQSQHELAGLDGKAAGQRRQRRRLVSVREGSLEAEKEGTKVAVRPRRDSGHQHHHSSSHTAHIDTSLMTATNTTVGSSASDEDDEDDVDIDEDVDATQKQRGNDVLARAAKLPQDFVAAALAVGAATKNATTTTATTNTPAVAMSSCGGPGAQAEQPAARQETTAFVAEGNASAVKKEAVTTTTQSSTGASANEGVAAAVGAPEATQESAAVKSYYEADALELNEASSGDAAHEVQEGSPCVIVPEMTMHTAPSVMNATTTTTTITTPTTTMTAVVTPSLDNAAWGSTSEAHFTPALADETGVPNQQATIAVTDKLQPCHSRVISFTPSLSSTVHNVNLMSASGHASTTPPPSPQPRIEAAVAAAQQQQHHLQQTRVEEHEVVGPAAEQTDEVMVTMEEKGTTTTASKTTAKAPLLSSHAAGKPPLWEHTTTLTASVHSAPLETRHTNLFTTHSRDEDEEEEGSTQESNSGSYNGSGDTVSRRSRSCTSETASMASRSNSTTSRTDSTDSEHSSTATSTSITSSGSDLANLMACSTPYGFGTSPDMTAFMRGNAPRVISVPGSRPNEDTLTMPAAQFCPTAAPQPLTRSSETDTAATNTTANTTLPTPQPTPYSPAEMNQAMHYGTDQLAGSDLLTAGGPMDEALLSSLQTISRPRQRRNQNLITGFATLRGIAYNVEDEPYTRYHPQPRNVVAATGEGVRTAFGRNDGPASRPAHHLDPMAQVPEMEAAAAATTTVANATDVARGGGNNKGTAFTTMDTRRNSAASPLNLSRTQPDTLLSNAPITTTSSQATPGAMASSPIGECGVPGMQTRSGQAYRVRPLRNSNAASLVQPAALQLTTGSDSDTTGRLSSATQSPKYVARVNNVVFEEGETTMPRLPQFLSRAVVAHGGSTYNNSSGNEQESSDVGSRSTGSPVQTRPQFALVPTTTIPANNTVSCYEGRDSAGVSRTMTPLGIATGAGSGPLTSPLYMTGASRSNNNGGGSPAISSHAIPVGERTGRSNGSYYDTPPSDFVTGTSYGGFDHFMNFSFAAPFPMSQTLRASIGGGAAAGGSSNNNNMSNSNAATVGAAGNVMGPPYCVSATNSVAAAAGANTTVSEVHDT